MGFIDIINGSKKASPEEIAREVASLEAQIETFQDEKETARNKSRRLRQDKIGGGQASDAQIKAADREYDDAALNVEAAEESLTGLKNKLKMAIAQGVSSGLVRCEKERESFKPEKAKLLEEIIETAGRLRALQIALSGGQLGAEGVVAHLSDPAEKKAFVAAGEKNLALLEPRLIFSKEAGIRSEESRLKTLRIDDEIERLISVEREKVTQ
jgi:hypothetical protein